MFETEIPIGNEVLEVRTHDCAHLHEVAAIWACCNFAKKNWLKKHCPENILLLGIGGGWADDHTAEKKDKKSGDSCFGIIVKSMGLANRKTLKHILEYVDFEEKHKSRVSSTLARVLWLMHQVWTGDEVENINWALAGIDQKCEDLNDDFRIEHIASLFEDKTDGDEWLSRGKKVLKKYKELFQEGLDEFATLSAEKNVLERCIWINGMSWPIVALESDNVRMSAVLRSDKGVGAGIVVIKKSSGHYFVSINDKCGAKFGDTIAIIRCLEKKKARRHQIVDWDVLREPGEIESVPEWYYFKTANMLMNGSITHPHPASRLTLKEVFYAVFLGLSPGRYHPMKQTCQQGICLGNDCDFYEFGMMRCRTIRYNMKSQAKAA